MSWVAGFVVVTSGLWLLGLAVAIWVVPARTKDFLRRFASSPRAHYSEQILRLIAGVAFVVYAAEMRFPMLFSTFGWVLVASAVGLLLMPWQWHRRFGEWAIPLAIRHLKLYALGALVLGAFVLYGVTRALLDRPAIQPATCSAMESAPSSSRIASERIHISRVRPASPRDS